MTMPPPATRVALPESREMQPQDEYTGRIAAAENVEIRPRVSGYVTGISFQSGSMVKKGQVLFLIDPRPFQTVRDRAAAELERAKISLEYAQREDKRTRNLVAASAVSASDADLKAIAMREAGAAVQSASAALQTAELDLEFSTVRSPIDGLVSREMVTAGNYVSGVAGFTTLLTTVVSTDPVHAYVDIDETSWHRYLRLAKSGEMPDIRTGKAAVEIAVSGEEGYPHKGTVESVDNQLLPASGSIVLRATVPNPDGALTPGAFTKLRVATGKKQKVTVVNDQAVATLQGGKFVLVAGPNDIVAPMPVKTGILLDGLRIITAGLKGDERIILNPALARIQPGTAIMPVMVNSEASPPPATAAP